MIKIDPALSGHSSLHSTTLHSLFRPQTLQSSTAAGSVYMLSSNKRLCGGSFPTQGNWRCLKHQAACLWALSCEIKEINIGFELRDGADQRQQSLTGQIGSDGPARSEYKGSAGFTVMWSSLTSDRAWEGTSDLEKGCDKWMKVEVGKFLNWCDLSSEKSWFMLTGFLYKGFVGAHSHRNVQSQAYLNKQRCPGNKLVVIKNAFNTKPSG